MDEKKSYSSGLGFARRQGQFVSRHAAGIVLALALLSAAAWPLASGLGLHANFMDLLPANTKSIMDLKALSARVGGSSYLIAVIESPSEEAARAAAGRFAERAASLEGVGYIDNRAVAPEFQSRKLLFLSLEGLQKLNKDLKDLAGYYRRKSNPLFVDLLQEEPPSLDFHSYPLEEEVSKIAGYSGKRGGEAMQVVLIKPLHPLSDFERSEKLFARVRAAFEEVRGEDEAPVTLTLSGPYLVRYQEYQTIKKDLQRTSLLSAALIMLIMIAGFRNVRSIFYISIPLGIGMLWTCAFAKLCVGYLNLISGFLVGILLGMGVDYAIHLRINLDFYYRKTGSLRQAVEETYAEVGKPIFTSCMTTASAFFTLAISPFEGFRQFGIICGAGIILAFLAVFYGVPALTMLGEQKLPPLRHGRPAEHKLRVPGGLIGAILAAGIAFTVYSAAQFRHQAFDYNFENLQARDEANRLSRRIYKNMGVELSPAAFITPDRAMAVELAGQINDYIKTHPDTTFHFAASVMSHVPRHQVEKILLLGGIDSMLQKYAPLIAKQDPQVRQQVDMLKEQLHPGPFGLDEVPEGIRRQYEDKDGQISVVFVYPRKEILDGQVAKRFIAEMRQLPVPPGVTLAGEAVIYAEILTLLERDMPRAMGLSLLLVALVIFVQFRRVSDLIWVLLPVALAFLWTAGMMVLLKFKFNYLNVVILPSLLGAGIDNGVYIFYSYKEKGDKSFLEALMHTGKGVFLSSLTAIAALASLLIAQHQGMASMGKLGVLGFTACFLTSMFFVPALITVLEQGRTAGDFFRSAFAPFAKRQDAFYKDKRRTAA
ncbi:MAG TPA: MMPL family transporter [Verrucomicrobiae bacterium]|nr:MMPL family transporter [Verrucomicrobiae bacterium]